MQYPRVPAAVIAFVLFTACGVSAQQSAQPSQPKQNYVVASVEESRALVPASVPVPQPDGSSQVPNALPLLLVGTLLLGLAAAVRRAT